jgi:hypothetical protein
MMLFFAFGMNNSENKYSSLYLNRGNQAFLKILFQHLQLTLFT